MPRLLPLLLVALLACRRPPPHVPSPADWALEPAEDCAAWDDPRLQTRLDRVTDSVAHAGNAVTLLTDGVESFARREENLRDAEVVLVKTYIWSDDETGRRMARLLAERARAGATVIIQYDLKGSLDGLGEALDLVDLDAPAAGVFADPALGRELEEAGVVVVPTNVPRAEAGLERWAEAAAAAGQLGDLPTLRRSPLTLRNLDHVDHEKYWITGHRGSDGRLRWRAILGGMNIASEYAYGGTRRVDAGSGRGGWRDTDVEVQGPVTLDIVRRYLVTLELNRAEPVPGLDRSRLLVSQPEAGEARVRFVWNQPALGNRRRIERLLQALISATPPEAVIRIEVAYFAPGRRLRRPLKRALREERRLAVLTNSADSIDVPLVAGASRAAYTDLLRASPRAALFEWRSRPDAGHATLHVKAASFGACGPAMVGSANLDGWSSEHNSESVVLIDDPAFRARFDAAFEADIGPAAARRLTLEAMDGAPLPVRLWRQVVYRLGWYFLSR